MLKGRITELKCSRRTNDFFLSAKEMQAVKATAIGSLFAGMSGIGAGLASISGNTKEEADRVAIKLDSGKIVTGWLWRCPFEVGDEVEVVAQPNGKNYQLFAVRRPADKMLAVYPFATHGSRVLRKNTIKYWSWAGGAACAIVTLMILLQGSSSLNDPMFWLVMGIGFAVFMLLALGIAFNTARKFKPFTQIAENNFRHFGWPDVENISMKTITDEESVPWKKARKMSDEELDEILEDESPEYEQYCFRYGEHGPKTD